MRRRLLALALSLAAAAPAAAATFPSVSFEQLAAQADLVVRVRATAREARWLEREGPSRIVTFHELRVLEVVGGRLAPGEAARGAVLVGVPGGVVADVGQWVPGAPTLEDGADYVVLLGRPEGPGGARGVLGLSLGVLPAGPRLLPGEQQQLEEALLRLRGQAP